MAEKISHTQGRDLRLHHEFFKVFIPQTSSQQLLIPPAFGKHLQDNLPRKITILDPAHRTSTVNLEREGCNLYLKEGWQEFVKDHALEYGDFLIFRYDGNSSFNVKIFGKNGCAKENNAVGICYRPPLHEQELEEVQLLWVRGRTSSSSNIFKKEERKKDECLDFKFSEKRKRGRPRKEDGQRSFKGIEHGSETAQVLQNTCGENVVRPLALQHYSPALDAANRYCSKYPKFVFVLTESYLRRKRMAIPLKFWRTYIKGASRYILLQVSERLWPVHMCVFRNSSAELRSGWQVFVRENDLQAGDVCVFELVKPSRVTLKVSIFGR